MAGSIRQKEEPTHEQPPVAGLRGKARGKSSQEKSETWALFLGPWPLSRSVTAQSLQPFPAGMVCGCRKAALEQNNQKQCSRAGLPGLPSEPPTSCVTLGKFLNFSETQSLRL